MFRISNFLDVINKLYINGSPGKWQVKARKAKNYIHSLILRFSHLVWNKFVDPWVSILGPTTTSGKMSVRYEAKNVARRFASYVECHKPVSMSGQLILTNCLLCSEAFFQHSANSFASDRRKPKKTIKQNGTNFIVNNHHHFPFTPPTTTVPPPSPANQSHIIPKQSPLFKTPNSHFHLKSNQPVTNEQLFTN